MQSRVRESHAKLFSPPRNYTNTNTRFGTCKLQLTKHIDADWNRDIASFQ